MEKQKIFIGEIKEVSDSDMIISHTITKKVVDRDGEVVLPTGMKAENFLKNPVVLFAHDYKRPAIGKCLQLTVSENEVVAKTQFAETELGKELYYLYKEGFMQAWSIGFASIKETDEKILEGQRGRTFEEWELFEYSAVPVPANPEALTLARSKGLKTEEVEKILKPEPDITENYIRIRVEDPDKFVDSSFRTIVISKEKGIKAVIGKYKSDPNGSTHVQSYLFDKDKWTVAEAEAWVRDNKDIEEVEEKSGRVLSEANRTKIQETLVLLKKVQEALTELLDISEPNTESLDSGEKKVKELLIGLRNLLNNK